MRWLLIKDLQILKRSPLLVALLVAYVPPAHSVSITIDMTALSGSTLGRWFDPSNATYTTIGTFPNTGTHAFNTPGTNASGFTDWMRSTPPSSCALTRS